MIKAADASHSPLKKGFDPLEGVATTLKNRYPEGVKPLFQRAANTNVNHKHRRCWLLKALASMALIFVAGDVVAAANLKGRLAAAGVTATKEVTFHDFAEIDFALPIDGSECKIVMPKNPADGNPWVWRARFWDIETGFDIAMLNNGYHLVYCEVAELWGAPKAVARWDQFYKLVTTAGLGPKPVLEGLSRGAVYCLNWAKTNPTKVAAFYGDNPLLDLRAFPRGTPEFERYFKQMLECYGVTESELPDFTNGIDVLAQAKVPVFFVLGAKDELVPIAKHADVFEARYKALGGSVRRWVKPDAGHHPHGLHPVDPLVDAVLEAVK